MKIFDCFMFFNELELLELRMMALNDVVDYFVIAEANKSHTGRPKDFLFEKNKDRFAPYLEKVVYVKVEDLPDYSPATHWAAENHHRNCLARGLGTAREGDWVLVSDVDEIPDPNAIELAVRVHPARIFAFDQILFYYYVNCMQLQQWSGTVISPFGSYGCLQELRNNRTSYPRLSPGGWHYSFQGGAERVHEKVANIAESHFIIDKVGSVEDIRRKMLTQADLWGRTEDYARKVIVDIAEPGMAPVGMKEFLLKYPEFFFDPVRLYAEEH